MTIPIRQSELNATGEQVIFPNLSWSGRRDTAARVLRRVGRNKEAFLLEINNVNAIAGITYVNDSPIAVRR
jgi:hypothetical protein